MQANPASLFLGTTPSRERSVLAKILQHARGKYKRLVIPCCGKFGAAEAAVAVGWKPNDIACSDVSLFSSVLGYHLAGKPLDDLQIRLTGDLTPLDAGDPATVLYALKLSVLRRTGKNYHQQLLARDLELRIADHIQHVQTRIDAIKAQLEGLEYVPRDLFNHLAEAVEDPEAVIYAAPPAYAKGYEKMFDTGGAIEWEQPGYRLFEPAEGYAEVRAMMHHSKPALGLRFVYAELAADEEPECVCAETTGGATNRKGAEYLLANRPWEVRKWLLPVAFLPRRTEIEPIDAPILDDSHVLTPESEVRFQRATTGQAMYYRDLFAHRLGTVNSPEHFLMMLDGRVAGVVGFGSAFSGSGQRRKDGRAYMTEMYGFTAPSLRYPRLNRLLMMLICSEEMHGYFRDQETLLKQYVGISTTCMCEHPELKINRGIMKLVSREREKNDLWKLSYVALWRKETFCEALVRWLKTHGSAKHARLPCPRKPHPKRKPSPRRSTKR